MLKYRPYLDIFLTKARDLFELVIYTERDQQYVTKVVAQIQNKNSYFDFILSEVHLVVQDRKKVKDFDRLGRSMDKMIILGFSQLENKKRWNNYIVIGEWDGDKEDQALMELADRLSSTYSTMQTFKFIKTEQ